jgi:hypothetical protein
MIFSGVLAAACSPQVVGRYQEATCFDRTGDPNSPIPPQGIACHDVIPIAEAHAIMVRATPAISSAGTKSGTDLPERALASYITALSDKRFSRDAAGLGKNIASPLTGPNDQTPLKDETLISGTLAITVSKVGEFNPADRLESLEVRITPINARVETWTAAQSVYSTITPGSITASLTRSAELDVASQSTTAPVAVTGKASVSSTESQTLNVNQRIEDVRPFVDPDGSIRVVRQGGFGVDLTGNVLVVVALRVNPGKTAFPILFSVSGGTSGPIGLKEQPTRMPRGTGPIKADVQLTYVLRHIISGDERYEDARQDVQMITYRNTSKQDLVPAVFVEKLTFGMQAPEAESKINPQPGTFVFASRVGRTIPLCFESFEAAQQVLDDLIKKPRNQIGAYKLGFPIPPSATFQDLDPALIHDLHIAPGCQPR